MAKHRDNDNGSNDFGPTACKYKQKLISQKFEEVDKGVDNLNNKVKVVSESIYTKLDEIDKAFRGNHKIGVFEKVRDIEQEIKQIKENVSKCYKRIRLIGIIIISILAILLGGDIAGIDKTKIKDLFSPKKEVKITEKQPVDGNDTQYADLIEDKGFTLENNEYNMTMETDSNL